MSVRRFKDAMAIWSGACNPSAVINSMMNAAAECRAENMGTAAICSDPALRLMVYQLAFLAGVISGAEECKGFPISDAIRECEQRAAAVVAGSQKQGVE